MTTANTSRPKIVTVQATLLSNPVVTPTTSLAKRHVRARIRLKNGQAYNLHSERPAMIDLVSKAKTGDRLSLFGLFWKDLSGSLFFVPTAQAEPAPSATPGPLFATASAG